MILELVFFVSLALVVYHYCGYPLAVMLLARSGSRASGSVVAPKAWPSVTLVIAAFNEEAVIGRKLRNVLALTYPPERLDVIVVADGSTDRTAEIVRASAEPRFRCLHDPRRRGKSHALNRAVAEASADVVVMSDANNLYSPDALQVLVTRLMKPGVGGVSGVKRVVEDAERAASTGDGLYWRYESRIKCAESAIGGTVTGDGEIFALHRRLYRDIPPEIINDDMYLTFRLVEQGYRVEFDPAAVAVEEGSKTIRDDFNVKVRMISGGFQNVLHDWRVALASGWYSVRFISHKLLRWLMPVFLAALLVANTFLLDDWRYQVIFAGQLVFYGVAFLGWRFQARGLQVIWAYVPFYFVAMNFAAAAAIGIFLRRRQTALWAKAER